MNLQESIKKDLKLFEGPYAYISGDEESSDPTVMIRGYGEVKFSQLKDDIVTTLEKALESAKKGNFDVANWHVNDNETLGHKIKALYDIEHEMDVE